MSPRLILVGRRGDNAVIHWTGVLLSFNLVLALVAMGAISASTALVGHIDIRAVGTAFVFAVIFMGILVRRGLRTPIEQLTPLDEPRGTGPGLAAEEQKGKGTKIVLGVLAAAVGIGTLGAWIVLPGGRLSTGGATLAVVAMLFITIFGAALAALGSRGSRAKPAEGATRLDGPPDRVGITSKVAAMVFAVMVLTITVSLLWLIWSGPFGPEEKELVPFMPPKTAVDAAVLAGTASSNGVSEVRCDGRKAYIQAELDDLHELQLIIGSDALSWSAQRTGSTSMTATVEAADQIKMDDGSTGHGLVFQAWSVRHNIAITPDGPVPYGEVVFRTNSMITQKDGTFTFADIRQANGTLVPVSIRVCPRPAAAEVSSNSAAQATRLELEPAQAESDMTGSRTNSDLYSGVTGHAYFCQGKPRAGLEGWEQGWKVEADCLVSTGEVARISTKTRFGKVDLVVSASLSLDELKGTGAAFIFGNGYAFEFDRADQRFAVTGLPLVRSRLALPAQVIVPGQRFVFSAERRGSLLDFFIDDKLIQTVQYDEEIGAIGFEPKKATMRIYAFGAEEMYPRSAPSRRRHPTLHPPRARSLSPNGFETQVIVSSSRCPILLTARHTENHTEIPGAALVRGEKQIRGHR